MRGIKNISLVLAASMIMVSCFDNGKPNYQYMPNMYEPVGYETYGEYEVFPGEQEAMLPAEGSIPRGWQPYDYANTPEGLELAKTELKNPVPVTEKSLSEGKELYDIYCALCHGIKGDGKGILGERKKIEGVPGYADDNRIITEGGVYHVQMYGLNSMGSYASQTNELERWQITQHVMNLKAALEGTPLLTPNAEDTIADAISVAQMPGANITSEENTSEEQH
ncbi:MAG: cytochrome c [Bacteroidota bacterium]